MADLAPGALRQGLRHAAGSIGAAVQATSGAAAAAARLNLLYEGYSGKEIVCRPSREREGVEIYAIIIIFPVNAIKTAGLFRGER